jgi:dolichyl-phosphate-mannose-protein mannosyltransferase
VSDHPALVATLVLIITTVGALRYAPAHWADRAARLLGARLTPWVLGVVTAALFCWVAGGTLDVEPISTDEASYVLQAEIFAAGKVTAPAPPIQDFFEQAWVVVSPQIFSKYPPGHALALAPGVAIGLPWLMPFLLNLVSGALLFGLLRRAVGAPAALLTWSAWVLSGMAMAWQTTYFSEVTLLACWLGGAALVWQWLDDGGTRWLVGAALLIGYGAVTRPLSILLLALPLIALVLRHAARHPALRGGVIRAAAAGTGMLLLLPLWNLGTTGDVTRSPLREYTESYLPWDRLGFAVESTAARRPTPPDLIQIAPQLARVHREHTLARLPRILLERGDKVRRILFTHWRVLLILPTLIGLFALGRIGWIAMAAVFAQWLGHAVWGHEAGWTLYYAESAALWFVPGAAGVVVVMRWLARALKVATPAEARIALAVILAAPFLFLLSVQDSAVYRTWRAARVTESRAFTDFVRAGPPRAIYFIKYGPPRSGRPGLVRNSPWLADAHAWVVYDLGARDQELLRAAPDRTGYLVDVEQHSVIDLPRAP